MSEYRFTADEVCKLLAERRDELLEVACGDTVEPSLTQRKFRIAILAYVSAVQETVRIVAALKGTVFEEAK